MLDSYLCPVCGHEEWSHVETFVYSKRDGLGSRSLRSAAAWRRLKRIGRILLLARPRKTPVTCRALSSYQLLRRRVLFEVWFPAREQVTLRAAYCGSCGFTGYCPRPTEQEVAAKYYFLKQHELDIGGETGRSDRALASDLARAATVYRRCASHLGPGKLRVLDYGGGNGKLLRPFIAAGHDCYLIDYNDNPVPGVTKICDDMSAFCGDQTFDLILCSHVLEHVSDIAGLAAFLRRHVSPEGLLYAEVPQEIWAGLGIDADPVTHINFFTPNSLATLFLLNDFTLVETRQQVAAYGGSPLEVIWLLARPRAAEPCVDKGSARVGDANQTGDTAESGHGRCRSAGPGLRDGRGLGDGLGLGDGRKTTLPADIGPLLYPSRITSLIKIWRLWIAPRLGRFRSTPRPSLGP